MITSESIVEISKALVAFHASVGKVRKASTNPFFKSKYANLSDILDVISEPLTEAGLAVVQLPHGTNELTTRLMHSSGEWLEDTYTMAPTKNDPQGMGSAITYQRRYAIGALLSLNIDEDDDGNTASRPVRTEQPQKLSIDDASYIVDGSKEINGAETLEALGIVGSALAKRSPAIKTALRTVYGDKLKQLEAQANETQHTKAISDQPQDGTDPPGVQG